LDAFSSREPAATSLENAVVIIDESEQVLAYLFGKTIEALVVAWMR
jgi:hypothetical protein